jgi:N-acetylglucosaminyl-diphospho-decaprenol L-rhamnosyltransferase
VTYRCRDAARACLRSLEETTRDLDAEVVVVDNASGDGTAEMIRADFPDVRLIALDRNLGFAAGVNLAAENAEGEHLLLLNPDTVVHDGAVENLVAFARSRPEAGLVGGRTLKPDGRVDPGSCWGQPSLWSLFCFATMLSTVFKNSRLFDPESLGGWERDSVREVGIVTGCLLLAPRAVWRRLGGFDLRYFMYGEDADLAMRAWAAGYRPAITPDSVVTHEVGVSSASAPDKLNMLMRGKVTLLRKHWRSPRRELGIRLLVAGVGLRALAPSSLTGRNGGRPGAWREVWRARRSWLEGYPEAERPRLRAVA